MEESNAPFDNLARSDTGPGNTGINTLKDLALYQFIESCSHTPA